MGIKFTGFNGPDNEFTVNTLEELGQALADGATWPQEDQLVFEVEFNQYDRFFCFINWGTEQVSIMNDGEGLGFLITLEQFRDPTYDFWGNPEFW
jgi:hypothetical protein